MHLPAPERKREDARVTESALAGSASRSGSQLHRSAPVRASNARTIPLGACAWRLSKNGRANDDEAVDDRRRRRHVIFVSELVRAPNPDVEIHAASNSEVGAWSAAASVQRDQPRIERRDVDSRATWRSCGARRVDPGGHPASGDLIVSECNAIDVRVEGPSRRSAFRIQCDHACGWRGDVQRAVEHQRRRFECGGGAAAIRNAVGDIPRTNTHATRNEATFAREISLSVE